MTLTVSDGFPYYIELVGNQNLIKGLEEKAVEKLLFSLREEQANYKYASGKWSIKQIVGHITDHERIMTYRALRFSRNDSTTLPGYDQDLFVSNSRFEQLSIHELLEDYTNVRNATISFYRSLSPEQLLLKGMAWKFELTVQEVLQATLGHELHHINILKERYLK